MSDKLTEKQALFCQCMFTIGSETFGNGVQSAKKAGYKGNDKTLEVVGSENLSKPIIKAEKARIQAKTVKKMEVTEKDVIGKLLEYARLTPVKGLIVNNRDSLRALELIGKHLAMFTDVVKDTSQQPTPLTDEKRKELSKIAEHLTKPKLLKGTG